MLTPLSGLLTRGPGQAETGRDDPERIREVAAEFESLLVAQMLKSLRESSSGEWLGGGDDQAGATMVELAEQQFARALASQGGLGLKDVIVKGLLGQENPLIPRPSADKSK